jgi:hypothetical protein
MFPMHLDLSKPLSKASDGDFWMGGLTGRFHLKQRSVS